MTLAQFVLSYVDWVEVAESKLRVLLDKPLIEESELLDTMVPRRFVVIRSGTERVVEWDEYYVLSPASSADRWVCFSTDAAGQEYGFYDVVLRVGDFRLVSGVGGQRHVSPLGAPAVAVADINWLCVPGSGERWVPPTEANLSHLQDEAAALAGILPARELRGEALVMPVGATGAQSGPPVLPIRAPWGGPGPPKSSAVSGPLVAKGATRPNCRPPSGPFGKTWRR